ncbi:MAG: hypothetical protein AAF515_15795 [Pseudomonadota bacterium]
MPRTVVVQSHRQPLPHPWLGATLASVRAWCAAQGFEYRFLGDELFALLPPAIRAKTAGQPVVASDLARLLALEAELAAGADRVAWLDADMLILSPETFSLPDVDDALFGREFWLQWEGKRLKTRRQIHNACMAFTSGGAVLPFYRFAAARLLRRHTGEMVPQLAGPKFLGHLHNVLAFDVLETAQVLSPPLALAVLERDEALLGRYNRSVAQLPAALNLCASEVLRGALADADVGAVIDRLLAEGWPDVE